MLFEEKHSRNNHYCYLAYTDMNCLLHCQSSFEVIFVKSGHIALELQGKCLTLQAGESAWILPYEIHRILTPEYSQVSIVIFSTDYLPDFYEVIRNRSLLRPVLPYSQDTPETLCSPSDRFTLKSALYALASQAAAGGVGTCVSDRKTDHSVQMMIYLQEHFQEPITLQSLADEIGYSYSYTSAVFKKYFQRSFPSVLNDYRLEQAADALLSTNDTITQISQQCGFATIRSFNMAFRNRFGTTPREYRSKANKLAES